MLYRWRPGLECRAAENSRPGIGKGEFVISYRPIVPSYGTWCRRFFGFSWDRLALSQKGFTALPGLSVLQPRAYARGFLFSPSGWKHDATVGGLSIDLLGRRIGQFLEILI